jgi:hypothetical protein
MYCTLIRQYMRRKSSNYQHSRILCFTDFMCQSITSHHSEYIYPLIIRVFFNMLFLVNMKMESTTVGRGREVVRADFMS